MVQNNMDITQRPVAVYGTLREGEGNWAWAIQPYGVVGRQAVIHNHAMYPMPAFPYVIPQEGAQVVVDIFDFYPADWDKALMDLDQLEGYRGEGMSNLYNRRVVTAITADGEEIEVYVYLAANENRVRAQWKHLTSGDWKAYVANGYEVEDMVPAKTTIKTLVIKALMAIRAALPNRKVAQ